MLVDDYEMLKYTILKLTSQLQPKSEEEQGNLKDRSSKANRQEVEAEMERVFSSLRTKDEEQEGVVKRLQQMLEGSETMLERCRRELEEKTGEVTALQDKVHTFYGEWGNKRVFGGLFVEFSPSLRFSSQP